jgi:hypothetical protein
MLWKVSSAKIGTNKYGMKGHFRHMGEHTFCDMGGRKRVFSAKRPVGRGFICVESIQKEVCIVVGKGHLF